jgi:hypothetical protein
MAQRSKTIISALFAATVFLTGVLGIGESSVATTGITRTNSGGGVTVKATYVDAQETDEARFEVVLDTHAVNLDAYDLKALSLLRDDSGKTYEPVGVENKGSGHHREIAIVFSKVSPPAKRLELVIKDIAGIKERSFLWDLDDKKK